MTNPYKERAEKARRKREDELERLRRSAPRVFPFRGAVYRWRVTHPDHEPAEVIGAVKLDAVVAASKKWGVPWSSVARACTFERLEEVTA